jgi:hypothetical protein
MQLFSQLIDVSKGSGCSMFELWREYSLKCPITSHVCVLADILLHNSNILLELDSQLLEREAEIRIRRFKN